MKIIIVSLPKAGTYITVELFKNLGYRFSGLHLQTTHYTNYHNADFKVARHHPEQLKIIENLDKSIDLIKENEFAVGHLPPNDEVKNTIRDFQVLFLQREIRASLFSYFRFLVETGRQNADQMPWYHIRDKKKAFIDFLYEQGERRMEMYDYLSQWSRAANIPRIRFEWLVGRDLQPIRDVLGIINEDFLNMPLELLEIKLSVSLNSDSITKSDDAKKMTGQKSFVECWTDEAERFFIKHDGNSINLTLGYS